jgi:hypothetical protein
LRDELHLASPLGEALARQPAIEREVVAIVQDANFITFEVELT